MDSSVTPTANQTRVQSIDLLRGLVMILMAIDHVRVYSGIPAGGTEVGIFFTRWITHYCAPAFAFLAGTSAFLYEMKIHDKGKLAHYLITRGFLLVVLELTVIRFLWAFHIDFTEFILAGIIWMLGWCMILLSAFIWMKPLVAATIGIVIILFQNLFSKIPQLLPETIRPAFAKYWEFIYPAGFETLPNTSVLYTLVPWIGVIAVGYGFGLVFQLAERKRNRFFTITGITMTLVFIIIGTTQIISSPTAGELPLIFRLLGQQKYPASTLFLLMTLGPIIMLMPLAEKATGWFSKAIIIIGRVPFFYYLAHIPVIHFSALLVQIILLGSVHHDWFVYAPYVFIEEPYRWNLPLLYLVFVVDVTILYFLCLWYARYKAAHPEKIWLKYL